jgi:hypothetical protein
MLTVQKVITEVKKDGRMLASSLILSALDFFMTDVRGLPQSQAQSINKEKWRLCFIGTISRKDGFNEKRLPYFVGLWIEKNGSRHIKKTNKEKGLGTPDFEDCRKIKCQALLILHCVMSDHCHRQIKVKV